MNNDDMIIQQRRVLSDDLMPKINTPDAKQPWVARRRIRACLITGISVLAALVISGASLGTTHITQIRQASNNSAQPTRASWDTHPTNPDTASTTSDPSMSTKTTTIGDIRKVDLANSTITVKELSICRAGKYKFIRGEARAKISIDNPEPGTIRLKSFVRKDIQYSDINHDGSMDAIVELECAIGYPSGSHVAVISNASGKLRVIGVSGELASDGGMNLTSIRVNARGVVKLTVNQSFSGNSNKNITVAYAWKNHGLSKTSQPKVDVANTRLSLPALSKCAAQTISFHNGNGEGKNSLWLVDKKHLARGPLYQNSIIDYMIVPIMCSADGGNIGNSLLGIIVTDSGVKILGYIPRTDMQMGEEFTGVSIDKEGTVTATLVTGTGETRSKRFIATLSGQGFEEK